jgi:hypothetical protein
MEDIVNWVNNNQGVTEPITITLEGDGDTSVDFEQAFGEFSEARGRRRERRRARRQERKLKRISRRQERKNARVDARLQRKQRIADARATRKGGDEEGGEEAGSNEPTSGGSVAPINEPTSGGSVDPINEPTSGGSVAPIDDSPSPLPPSYPPSEDSDNGDTAEEEQAVEEETGASDEESGFTGDYGFDGQRQPSAIDNYWDNFYSSAEGEAKIHPKVTELSRRIEKNKELAKRIQIRIAKINARIQASNKPIGRVDANVVNTLTRQFQTVTDKIAELESKLAGYSKFVGDYSDASGEQRQENARRRAEVRQAKRSARKERQNFIKAKRKARVQEIMTDLVAQGVPRKEARMKARQQAKAENPFKATQVEAGLNADISPNKIVVPPSDSSSSFNGTGLIGLDDYNDFDAPPVRNVELDFSNASGKMKGNWKWIAIGVVVAVGGIFAYNKFVKKK